MAFPHLDSSWKTKGKKNKIVDPTKELFPLNLEGKVEDKPHFG